jgi:hypothetical protein
MKTKPEERAIIHNFIYPSLTGARRLVDFPEDTTHLGFGEIAIFQALLSSLRPKCAIEVGTDTGCTLALISRYSSHAISVDIDPNIKIRLQDKFTNVEFLTGSSHDVLPVLLARLESENITPDFIFVDGDHSAAGVNKDVEFILNLKPRNQVTLLMHDTFNPGCRHGIFAANWARNPHCHYVDLDFCPGALHPDASCLRQMWGGIGYALFLPDPRQHELEVKRTHQLTYEAAFQHSVYNRNLKAR